MECDEEEEYALKDIIFHVCVPVYNAARFLRLSIESVLSQDFDDIELVLVDDGSSDDSLAICRAYAETNSHVVVIHQTNKGQYEARQVAIQHVLAGVDGIKEDWILFLDADDIFIPGAFSKIAGIIKSDTSIDTIVYAAESITEAGEICTVPGRLYEGIVDNRAVLYDIVTCGGYEGYNALWHRATRASLFAQLDYSLPISSLRYGEDAVHTMMLFELSEKTIFIKDRLYLYRQNKASVSATLDAAHKFEDHLLGTQMIYNIVKRGGGDTSRYLNTNCNNLAKRILLVFRSSSLSWKERCLVLSNIQKWPFVDDAIKKGTGLPKKLVEVTKAGNYRLSLLIAYFMAVQNKISSMLNKQHLSN